MQRPKSMRAICPNDRGQSCTCPVSFIAVRARGLQLSSQPERLPLEDRRVVGDAKAGAVLERRDQPDESMALSTPSVAATFEAAPRLLREARLRAQRRRLSDAKSADAWVEPAPLYFLRK